MSNRSILVFFIIFCVSTLVFCQQNDNSPYSRYGIGILSDRNFNHTRQMGGLGSSYIDGHQINIVNPASYSFLNAAAFDIGIFAKNTLLTDGKQSNTFWSGNLEYLSLAFPLKNSINELYDRTKSKYKLGMNFTLRANSSVSYNVTIADSTAEVGNFDRRYSGSGGTYKFQWGNSIRTGNFGFGVNLGYLFGKIKKESNLLYEPSRYAYNSFKSTSFNMKGFALDLGVIYTKELNSKERKDNKNLPTKRISVGFNFKAAESFKTKSDIDHNLVQQLPNGIFNVDTVLMVIDSIGRGKIPAELGLGATYYVGEKWAIGFNVSSSFWSKYYNEASSEVVGSLSNSSRYSIGGFYRPNYKSVDNFFQRVFYRYGFYYENDALAIDNNQLQSYGLTLGMGMPVLFQRKISHLNLGATFGSRGAGTRIEERFVKISLGMTFNDDEWFLKRKYY